MTTPSWTLPTIDRFKRVVLMTMIALGALATVVGWCLMDARGEGSPELDTVWVVTTAVLSALFVAAWLRLLSQRLIELICLVFAVGTCAACMALRMYSPRYGASIDLQPLYLWIPVLYVFAFTLTDHRTGLKLSLGIMLLYVLVSLPYLMRGDDAGYANFTVQLHVVSVVLIVALYFFASYQHRLVLVQQRAEQLARLSNTDELTKLSNRRRMAAAIETELALRTERGGTFALMLFDVDHFKAVNDGYGHAAGDATLVALAARATQVFRATDTVGRWGGDEFLALVRDVGPEEAMRLAQVLCREVAAAPLADGHPVTVSCGATVSGRVDNIDSLLQRADAALYAAKRAGRNRAEGILEVSSV